LGRVLGALIPTEVLSEHGSALLDIPVNSIEANESQPRNIFDEEALVSLAASIREVGVLQPVLVRDLGNSRYQLIAGERRWRAAKRVGLPSIPAIVRSASEAERVEHALIENLHRQDLNPMEEASAYQQLIEDFGLTHEKLSARVGKSRAAITNALRLFQLPPSVQDFLRSGQVSSGHARALLSTPDRSFQESLAKRLVAEGLSVRSVEEAVKDRNSRGVPEHHPRTNPVSPPPAAILELEELLSSRLSTSVKVTLGAKRGRLTIEFASLEDLERIYRTMTDPEQVEA
jgi:ParB family chromosome partitioning protein